jgi:two-component system LytT family response regulator
MNTVIVDDELNTAEAIAEMLAYYCPQVNIVAQAHSVKEAYQVVKEYQPDLLLLDINMPDGTGFDLLKQLDVFHGEVVFITAFDQHAIEAFRVKALDYLLKPIDPDQLIKVVQSAEKKIMQNRLLQYSGTKDEQLKGQKLTLKTEDAIHLVDPEDIIRCESEGNYTHFYLTNEQSVLVGKTMKHFEPYLIENGFYRIHRSHLINVSEIQSFERRDGGVVLLKNGVVVPVASRKREAFLKMLDQL